MRNEPVWMEWVAAMRIPEKADLLYAYCDEHPEDLPLVQKAVFDYYYAELRNRPDFVTHTLDVYSARSQTRPEEICPTCPTYLVCRKIVNNIGNAVIQSMPAIWERK
ncbi:hypothetical protein A3K63_03090 [Candidatus Micrarchaeota archaeon RBG_16_49_10]|nr:MAG: hypothetical protein A3K63_03090 [Candidatus Micrarchaeota archaeon RBG_16_49_10]